MKQVDVHIAGGERELVMKAVTQTIEGIGHVGCCRYIQIMLRAVDAALINDFTSLFEKVLEP